MKKAVEVGSSFLIFAFLAKVAVDAVHEFARRVEQEKSYVQDGIDWLSSNG